MFESQGTTPAEQASTIATPSIAMLQARIAELEAENGRIAELEREAETNRKDLVRWFDKYLAVKNFIQASLDREEWTTEELSEPYWEELANLLNLELKLERDIVVTVTWNLTVKGKTDLSSWDFNPSIESDTGSLDIVSGEDHPDIEISE
jgi:hypothetical protein